MNIFGKLDCSVDMKRSFAKSANPMPQCDTDRGVVKRTILFVGFGSNSGFTLLLESEHADQVRSE